MDTSNRMASLQVANSYCLEPCQNKKLVSNAECSTSHPHPSEPLTCPPGYQDRTQDLCERSPHDNTFYLVCHDRLCHPHNIQCNRAKPSGSLAAQSSH